MHPSVFAVLPLISSASTGCRELYDLRRWWVVDSGGTIMYRKSIPRIHWPLPKLTYTKGFGIKVLLFGSTNKIATTKTQAEEFPAG